MLYLQPEKPDPTAYEPLTGRKQFNSHRALVELFREPVGETPKP